MGDVQDSFYRLAPHLLDTALDEDGTIDYAGRRFVWFHTDVFATLFDIMEEVAGDGIEERIEEFGYVAGQNIAEKMDQEFKDVGLLEVVKLVVASGFDIGGVRDIAPTDDMAQINKIWGYGRYVGWTGHVGIEEYEEGERAVFAAKNSFEADSYGDTGEQECSFVPGVLKGIVSYYWGEEDLAAREEDCECAGDDACRTVIEHA